MTAAKPDLVRIAGGAETQLEERLVAAGALAGIGAFDALEENGRGGPAVRRSPGRDRRLGRGAAGGGSPAGQPACSRSWKPRSMPS